MATWTYSGNIYDASPPGTTTFPLTTEAGNAINYLQRSHIHVYKSVDSGLTYTELTFATDYQFNTEGTEIILNAGIAAGEWIKLLRITPYQTEYVEYQASSQLTAAQLNTGEKFSMYVDQELYDDITVVNEGYISDAPNDGNLYGRESEAWAIVPSPGISDAPDDGNLYGRESEAWTVVPPPGIADAPSDNKEYARLNGNWVQIPEDQTGVPEAPIDSKTYGRNDAAWVEITGGTGGLVYKGTRDLTLAAPSSSADGDFYVNTATSGVAAASWTGIAGDALTGAERVAYDGTNWEMLPSPAAGVEEIVAGNDITINDSEPAKPVISVTPNSFLSSITAGQNITVTNGSTVGVEAGSFLPFDIGTLLELPENPDPGPDPGPTPGDPAVTVTSSSFSAGAAIGQDYYFDQGNCGGQNTSPQLSWSATDLATGRSVASWNLLCDDPDAQNFIHWQVLNIPATQTSIAENATWEAGAQVQQNSFSAGRANGWGGPCPPEQHTYRIIVIATLDDGTNLQSAELQFTASP